MLVITRHTWGTVYLAHLASPLGNPANPRAMAQHYSGFTPGPLPIREAEHRAGRGSKLLAAANERGISWEIVRTWEAPLGFEKILKQRFKNARPLCPCCAGSRAYHRASIVPLVQLELPLVWEMDPWDLPDYVPPRVATDYYEVLHYRRWGAAHAAPALPAGWDEGLV